MKVIIQHASDVNASIESVLLIGNEVIYSLSNPSDNNLYFTALLSNQPPIHQNPSGIVGLLLLPCTEIVQQGTNNNDHNMALLTPECCKLYLMAVSCHIDAVLGEWIYGKMESHRFNYLMMVR
jgi:hypothetical protein